MIELLVVVLIIGILAAIALPQYQKAVFNSKASKLFFAGKSFAEAANVWWLTNGDPTAAKYPTFQDLDVSLEGWTPLPFFTNSNWEIGTEKTSSIENNKQPEKIALTAYTKFAGTDGLINLPPGPAIVVYTVYIIDNKDGLINWFDGRTAKHYACWANVNDWAKLANDFCLSKGCVYKGTKWNMFKVYHCNN